MDNRDKRREQGMESTVPVLMAVFLNSRLKQCEGFLKGKAVNRNVRTTVGPSFFGCQEIGFLIISEVNRIH